ncbi:hypothetical protein FHR24_001656 [Wenyingzhuangia heitensis]|uniref:Secretion system C-terminal sorting domain-containing protein n=1 Tax=Wenyingzhuangia heitensis TaxID=1487859 RepID=A0ABX0U8P2_9FLAO|nr:T9SS type A sorting domain-containing protein [Wenyingzhuangia heitensis]NIJ45217.1 hypothetical protein [Wenyingzhuangia heitensis]
MKKNYFTLSTLFFLFGASVFAQIITLSEVTTIEFSGFDEIDENGRAKPTSGTPDVNFSAELTGFAAETTFNLFCQLYNSEDPQQQIAGVTKSITTDINGDASTGNIVFSYWPSGRVAVGETIKFSTSGGGAGKSKFIASTAPTLSNNNTNSLSEFGITPNPTTGIVQLTGVDKDLIQGINIYNTLGELVGHSTDLSNLNPGTYFFKIITKDNTSTKKIIKK